METLLLGIIVTVLLIVLPGVVICAGQLAWWVLSRLALASAFLMGFVWLLTTV